MEIGRRIGQTLFALQAIPRTAALSVVGPSALLILGYFFWSFWGAKALDQTYFSLKADKLRVTEQPSWIKANVAKEVYDQSFLKDVSVLDRNAASTIARAFDLHPWVRRTTRVTKLPDGEVMVDVEYRQPLAMVGLDPSTPMEMKRAEGLAMREGTAPTNEKGTWKFIPVDAECVIVPHFEPEKYQIRDYLLLYAKGTTTSKRVGDVFGDSRIADGVKLCILLNPLRRELKLLGVYVREEILPSGRKEFILDVETDEVQGRRNRRLTWGHAPGSEVPGELDITTKLQKLYQFFSSENPGLNSIDISGLARPTPN